MPVFARRGYHAAPTAEIARAADISHSYMFRLFPTKADLFAAVCDAAGQRMLATFRRAASIAHIEERDPFEEMARAYTDLLEVDRDVLLVHLHSQVAASGEPVVREAMQRTFRTLFDYIAQETGAPEVRLQTFFARGMLCNVMAAIDAEQVDEPWARVLNGEHENQ